MEMAENEDVVMLLTGQKLPRTSIAVASSVALSDLRYWITV